MRFNQPSRVTVHASEPARIPPHAPQSPERGFTLVELLVVLGIIIFVSGALLFQGGGSKSDLEVTNVAYDLALLLREAQAYGVGVREGESGATPFNVGYGVAFNAADTNHAYLFNDLDRDQVYDSPGETVRTLTLPKGITITEMCGYRNSTHCVSAGGLVFLTVSFLRPNPDAKLVGGPNGNPGSWTFSRVEITLTGLDAKTRTIQVLPTGQISVIN